jgi:hypothetical protein
MNRIVMLGVALVFGLTTAVFAQAAPTGKTTVKEKAKEELQAVKKDAAKMKEGITREFKEQGQEAKKSTQEVKKAVEGKK